MLPRLELTEDRIKNNDFIIFRKQFKGKNKNVKSNQRKTNQRKTNQRKTKRKSIFNIFT
jgi:hypothetical protein